MRFEGLEAEHPLGHLKESLVFPLQILPPSHTPDTQQLGSGGADLHQVLEAVDVGNEIGHKDGAVLGSAPRLELLLKPVGKYSQVTLTVGALRMPHLLCTWWCQETPVAGPTCPLCMQTSFFLLS